MTSTFTVRDANGYEQLVGRCSRLLAPAFVDFTGTAANEKILDVGCGTGSLSFELARRTGLSEIRAIDYSPTFVEAARQRSTDPRVMIEQADATALPFEDGSFDRAMALLVLHFVPDTPRAIGEMRRVVRSGGVVAASVWDHLGGMTGMRMIVDTLAALSDSGRQLRNRYVFQPMMQPGEMKRAFVDQGLEDVVGDELMVRMDYRDFDDLGRPSQLARVRSANSSRALHPPSSTKRRRRSGMLMTLADRIVHGRLPTWLGSVAGSYPNPS
jgi:ubiquinone/menaquinone biosynthesis C-methylase UbiE